MSAFDKLDRQIAREFTREKLFAKHLKIAKRRDAIMRSTPRGQYFLQKFGTEVGKIMLTKLAK